MSKKAQGMSMNVIIIAALALLVLVVLAIIFIGRMGKTTEGIDACVGTCTSDECSTLGDYYREGTGKCTNEDDTCCVGVGSGPD